MEGSNMLKQILIDLSPPAAVALIIAIENVKSEQPDTPQGHGTEALLDDIEKAINEPEKTAPHDRFCLLHNTRDTWIDILGALPIDNSTPQGKALAAELDTFGEYIVDNATHNQY